jgi:hypothetical protein
MAFMFVLSKAEKKRKKIMSNVNNVAKEIIMYVLQYERALMSYIG